MANCVPAHASFGAQVSPSKGLEDHVTATSLFSRSNGLSCRAFCIFSRGFPATHRGQCCSDRKNVFENCKRVFISGGGCMRWSQRLEKAKNWKVPGGFRRSNSMPAVITAADGDPIRDWMLTEGGATKVTKISPVSGGCINIANRWDTDVGPFFVKTNRDAGPSMFEAEAKGLLAMFEANAIRVPRPFKVGPLPRRGSFIIMEYIQFGAGGTQALLGRQLAEMHKSATSTKGFGFDMDNTIGSTAQPNRWTSDWTTFFREHRIGFQLDLALRQYRDNDIYEKGKRLMENLPELLGGVEVTPCLLHGDLWSGNVTADKEGNPVILDPACYYGHNEAEFGMSWCAGFGPSFYSAYFEVMPKQAGFEERVELYKLYHYLNHYNLFGSGYRGSCISIIDRFL